MKRLMLLTVTCAAMASVHAADLNIAVDGAKKNGDLYFALFDRANFLGKPIAVTRSSAEQAAASFHDLAPGSYAVSMFQDMNANATLDRNLVGAPTEPYGFSNDAMGNMGPPSFDAAAIDIGTDSRSISITLR